MSNTKNILFISNNLGNGGAEKVLVNLVNNMNHQKYNVTLRTIIDGGENKQYLNNNIKYDFLFKRYFKGINYLNYLPSKYIYKKLTHGNFDVIIVYLHGVLTKIISNAPSSQKTIAYLHANMESSPFIKSFKNKKQIQKCFNNYNAIVSVSKSVEESFKKVSGINKNLHVIYNTFDVENIKLKSREKLTDLVSTSHEVVKICSVGKLTKVKGYERLLIIIKRLRDEKINLKLTIVGDGEQKEILNNFIRRNNLDNDVQLVGFQSNPYKYIAESDLFICSSYSEGFSSVVVESIITGTPVLTTKCAGMAEIIGENNEYGVIVENDSESLYNGLKRLLTNKTELGHYTMKSKERSNYFSTENGVNQVENLIDKILKNDK
ncbi:MAG: glycosyltransferase [Psychroflexus halocasei]